MLNILFITIGLGFGGAEKMLCYVANQLCYRGHKVVIANLNTVPDYVKTKHQSLDDGVEVIDINSTNTKYVRRFEQIKNVLKIAKHKNSDIIIGFTSMPNFIAKIVGGILKIPSIMSERGDPYKTGGRDFKSQIIRWVINQSNGGVFQTEGAREFYGRGLQKRGVVIPNPIFINGEIPCIDYNVREKSVVSVGRLDNFQKRYDVMLDAFKLFSDKHPEYVLKLYGKGGDEELIKSWVEEKNLTNKVIFMGLTTQPMQDICNAGMFLITSDYEGISNSLLEAMAVGLPCVSTDHTPGGARLLITDHENGLLAPVEDAQALADAMCEYAEKTDLAIRCGENAKDVVNRFAPQKIIDMWEDYLMKLCENKKG